jgi:heme/copper-type cytochrome/quinol oxidase subunit 2
MGIGVALLGRHGYDALLRVPVRQEAEHESEDIKDNLPLEVIWTVIPTLLVLAMFWVGWKGFQYMRTVRLTPCS